MHALKSLPQGFPFSRFHLLTDLPIGAIIVKAGQFFREKGHPYEKHRQIHIQNRGSCAAGRGRTVGRRHISLHQLVRHAVTLDVFCFYFLRDGGKLSALFLLQDHYGKNRQISAGVFCSAVLSDRLLRKSVFPVCLFCAPARNACRAVGLLAA